MALPVLAAGLGLAFLLTSEPSATEDQVPLVAIPPPAPTNPVLEREQLNSRPGRFDNLPMLNSVYSDPAYKLTPEMVGRMQYGANDGAETPLQAQYGQVLEPQVTPLSLGVLPQVTRGTGLRYQDPLTPDQLKPKKHEIRTEDLWQPSGTPYVKGRQPIVHQQMQQRIEQRETKLAGGHGAGDGFSFHEPVVQPGPHISIGNTDALSGYSNGEYMTPRSGGVHPRVRIFRVPETLRGRLDSQLVIDHPTHAVGNPGSMYQTATAPLGEVRQPYNAFVTETYRPPEAERGIKTNPMGHGIVDMGVTHRGGTEQTNWTGPMGSEARDRHARRIVDMYVKPKMTTIPHEESGPADAPRGVTRGAYEAMNAAQDLMDQAPQRVAYMDSVTQMPAPHAAFGNNAAFSYYQDQRHTAQERDTAGRVLGGGRDFDMAAGGGQRFYNPVERDPNNKDTGLQGDQPTVTRSTAQQLPDNFRVASRKVTPDVLVAPNCDATAAYRSNPYVPPLPYCNK